MKNELRKIVDLFMQVPNTEEDVAFNAAYNALFFFYSNLPDEPLTGAGSTSGTAGDTSASDGWHKAAVAEAKRETLHHLLIAVAERTGGLSAVDAAALVNQGYAALESQPGNDELTAALLTISNIQNALSLPGEKGISEEVIDLVKSNESLELELQKLSEEFSGEPGMSYVGWLRRELTTLRGFFQHGDSFSDALIWLKGGKRIARKGWNGKDQWVVLIQPGNAMYTVGGASAPMQACFGLKNAQGVMQPGWVPSMGDLMANDWVVVQ